MLEQKVREAIGKPRGPITAEDAAALTWLDAEAPQDAPEEAKIKSLDGLGAFANLEGLRLSFHDIHDIGELTKLPRLRGLWLDGNTIDDLTPWGSSPPYNWPLPRVSGAALLKTLTELRELHINGCGRCPRAYGAPHPAHSLRPRGELEAWPAGPDSPA